MADLPTRKAFMMTMDPLDCSICGDYYDPDHLPVQMACGHIFGHTCIRTWASQDIPQANTCPLCRAVLFQSEFRDPDEFDEDESEGTPSEDDWTDDEDSDSDNDEDFEDDLEGESEDEDEAFREFLSAIESVPEVEDHGFGHGLDFQLEFFELDFSSDQSDSGDADWDFQLEFLELDFSSDQSDSEVADLDFQLEFFELQLEMRNRY